MRDAVPNLMLTQVFKHLILRPPNMQNHGQLKFLGQSKLLLIKIELPFAVQSGDKEIESDFTDGDKARIRHCQLNRSAQRR